MPVAKQRYPASWVDKEDWIVLELSTSLYADHITSKDGWELVEQTNSVAAWVRGEDAIVGIMGTSAKTGVSNLLDDAALAGVIDGACDLAVVNQAEAIVERLGDKNIIVAGHSLGGAAAFCIAHKGNVKRAVAFNPGAPPTGGGLKGTGENCRAYHVVGDIISTHIDDTTADVTRIHLKGDVNWNDVKYYHSTDRFFENKSYDIWHAQEEQDSLEKYIYNQSPTTALMTLVTRLITKDLNKDRIREIVCKNPIPDTKSNCPDIPNAGQVLTTFGGGLLGLAGGPAGVLAGLKLGYDIGGGSGLLDILAPGGVDKIKQGFKRAIQVGQNVNRTLSKRPRLR